MLTRVEGGGHAYRGSRIGRAARLAAKLDRAITIDRLELLLTITTRRRSTAGGHRPLRTRARPVGPLDVTRDRATRRMLDVLALVINGRRVTDRRPLETRTARMVRSVQGSQGTRSPRKKRGAV
jgi:hypothetical protein